MSLLVVGLSHRSAPVSVLERAALVADARSKLLHDTLATEPAAEAAVLATCNRIELYADVDKFHAGVAELSTLLARHTGIGLEELTPYLYVHYEDRAVHHLFSVACGLDSMVVGEGQILGQIKDALALGQELHTAGRLLNDLFQQALRVGKRAHSETGIDKAGQSLVTFGLEQLADGAPVQEWARGKRALVIGAGSMSSLAAATLARSGVAELAVANRTLERAERLAAALTEPGGPGAAAGLTATAVPMADVPAELAQADIVVSCTGATGLVLTVESVLSALTERLAATAEDVRGRSAADAQAQGVRGRSAADVESQDVRAGAGDARGASDAGPRAAERGAAGGGAHGGQGPQDAACPLGLTDGARRAAPLLHLLDLAMPRDVDAAAHRVEYVRLVDIESLAEASADAPMAADVDRVRTIVADEVEAFGAAQRAAHITPTVVALRTMAADLVASEISRLDGRLPDLDDKERAEITQTVRRVVDKLLHAPTVRVKQLAATPGGAGYADALRELFDLDPQAVAAVSRADTRSDRQNTARERA
ncbi:glutamyl-tRNA reductase [Streptomyces varsoviensis]|uniref:glutamyl-tRNA reductase n=1 Tax=Streptomyces varsoviensis TaxID=67373 RepID=UPI0033FC94C4